MTRILPSGKHAVPPRAGEQAFLTWAVVRAGGFFAWFLGVLSPRLVVFEFCVIHGVVSLRPHSARSFRLAPRPPEGGPGRRSLRAWAGRRCRAGSASGPEVDQYRRVLTGVGEQHVDRGCRSARRSRSVMPVRPGTAAGGRRGHRGSRSPGRVCRHRPPSRRRPLRAALTVRSIPPHRTALRRAGRRGSVTGCLPWRSRVIRVRRAVRRGA